MQQTPSEHPHRTVKRVKTIMANPVMRARVFTLAPRDVIPWHRHSEVTDHYFVLRGHSDGCDAAAGMSQRAENRQALSD